jgi:hypothetical protein
MAQSLNPDAQTIERGEGLLGEFIPHPGIGDLDDRDI